MENSFKEKQRFDQWWLWCIILLIMGFGLYLCLKQLITGEPVGSKPMSDWGTVLFLLFTLSFGVFFYINKLETLINKDGVTFSYFPYKKEKNFSWDSIASATLVDYGFVGYGIRYGSSYGVVYNTAGNQGLAIVLKSGKKFVIGTRKPEELQAILNQYTATDE